MEMLNIRGDRRTVYSPARVFARSLAADDRAWRIAATGIETGLELVSNNVFGKPGRDDGGAPGRGVADSIDLVLTVETRVERTSGKSTCSGGSLMTMQPGWKTGDQTLAAFGRIATIRSCAESKFFAGWISGA